MTTEPSLGRPPAGSHAATRPAHRRGDRAPHRPGAPVLAALAFVLASCALQAPESRLREADPTAVTVPPGQGLLVAHIAPGNSDEAAGYLGAARIDLTSMPNDDRITIRSKSGRQANYVL